MTTFLNSHGSGRSLLVAFVVGVATATVASKVALHESPAPQALFGATRAAAPPTAARTASVTALGGTDPSVPAAADVVDRLGSDGSDSGEAAPTF